MNVYARFRNKKFHKGKIALSNLTIGLLSGCGGGDQQNAETARINVNDATITVVNASARLSEYNSTAIIKASSIDLSNARNGTLKYFDIDELGEFELVDAVNSVLVDENQVIFSEITEYSALDLTGISLKGNLWLTASQPLDVNYLELKLLVESDYNLTLDMPSDQTTLVLEEGSTITLNGTNLNISDGHVDVANAIFIGINDIVINSELTVLVEQIDTINGHVSSDADGVLFVKINTFLEADRLFGDILEKINVSEVKLHLEPISSELMNYLQEKILLVDQELAFNIRIVDGENDEPENILFNISPVNENELGAVLGTYEVVDADINDAHTVTCDDERFEFINGIIKIRNDISLNFEEDNQLSLRVTVTDTNGASITREIEVNVLDVNEPPTAFELSIIETDFLNNISSDERVARLNIEDDALGEITYSVNGGGAEYFEIRNGYLYLKEEVSSLEVPVTTFDLIISATDISLIGAPIFEQEISVVVRGTTTDLDSGGNVVAADLDFSLDYSEGDQLGLTFSEAVKVSSFNLDDITGSGLSWGINASLIATGGSDFSETFTIILGEGAEISAESMQIREGKIEDANGLLNANRLEFGIPDLSSSISSFDIDIVYSGDQNFLPLINNAIEKWESIIIGDISDTVYFGFELDYWGTEIDDILMIIDIVYIDGYGGTLGQAGPDYSSLRDNGLPSLGYIEFDNADLYELTDSEIFDLVFHEMGHVLGFGTVWDEFSGLVTGSQYNGQNAIEQYQLLGGDLDYVPLETEGGSGTAYSHWDEDIFQTEIMTGYLDGSNQVSKITIGSMEDLGYEVNYAGADIYSIPTETFA